MIKNPSLLSYIAESDLALTYALRRPKLAQKCAREALCHAVRLGRPDLTLEAATLAGILDRR